MFFQMNLTQGQNQLNNIKVTKAKLISEFMNELENEIKLWYPLCIDKEYGGYYSDINYKWELDGATNKNDCNTSTPCLVKCECFNIL